VSENSVPPTGVLPFPFISQEAGVGCIRRRERERERDKEYKEEDRWDPAALFPFA
jgi:hypothetical protein